jgi:hypothetical protein
MDICARMRFDNHAVIKVVNAQLDHAAFSSHDESVHSSLDYFRNWHYMWSSYYIRKKYKQYTSALFFALSVFFLHILKIIFYLIFLKKEKIIVSKAKIDGLTNSIFNNNSFFRIINK